MSEQTDLTGKSKRSITKLRVASIGILVVLAAIVVVCMPQVDDVALAQALMGTWTAVDPNDASLHRRVLPVAHEQLVINAEGELTHVVELVSDPSNPDKDIWGWKVRKGRLYVQYRGDNASGQWLPGIAFSVSGTALSMRLKGHPPKKWVRR